MKWPFANGGRENVRAVRQAERELRTAQTLDDQAYRRARAAAAAARGRQQLARYGAFILYDDGVVTPGGGAGLSSAMRARIDTGANLVQARGAALARPTMDGPAASSVVKELCRHPKRSYLLVEAPGLISVARVSPEDASAREFAARVNVVALNAETLARRREEAIAAAEAQVEEIERRRASAAEGARANLQEAGSATQGVEAAPKRRRLRGRRGEQLSYGALRALIPYVRPYWRPLAVGAVGVVSASLVGLLKPWPLKFLIDDVLDVGQPGGEPQGTTAVVAAVAAAIVGIAVLQGLCDFLKDFFLTAASNRVAFSLRRGLFAHLQRLSLAFHDKQRTGDMLTRVMSDVGRVQGLITDKLLVEAATSIVQFVGMLAVMLVIDWRLALIALGWTPILVIVSTSYRRRIRAREAVVRQHEGDVASLAQETLSSIRVVKAFGAERVQDAEFEQRARPMLEGSVSVARLDARFAWVSAVLTSVGLAAVVFYGANQVLAGALSIGTLVVFISYMRDLHRPLNVLSRIWTQLPKAMIRAERIAEVLNESPGVAERPGARRAPPLLGQIRLDGVSFGYSPRRLAIQDVNIRVEPGETVAIVGPTGAGKSTIASLVLRLYDPLAGAVLIDGHDIREYRLESVTDQIGVVLQESLLFQTTIRENIAYGRPQATREEIERAASAAYCDEFLSDLPEGLETVVGERGTTLSGGQRQRLAIARALVRDAPILVLDEPTTGLDAESEEIVMQALERLMEGRSTILIAHKLSTTRRAHRIYVMEHGQVVEEGTHAELTMNGGHYARAFDLQSLGEASSTGLAESWETR